MRHDAVLLSSDTMCASVGTEQWSGYLTHTMRNVMSAEPTSDFTVELINDGNRDRVGLVVGFATPAAFTPDTSFFWDGKRGTDGVYALSPENGMLWGHGKWYDSHCPGFVHGTMRCRVVTDGAATGISFAVNGVERRVEWIGAVLSGPLHAVVLFWPHACGVGVELL